MTEDDPNDDPGPLVLGVLLGASMLTVVAGATVTPALPGIAAHFKDTPQVEYLSRLTLTLPALMIALSAPIQGLLIDRSSARKVLMGSLSLYAIAGCSGLLAPTLTWLLVGRAFVGLSVAGSMTSATTLIGQYFAADKRSKVLGFQGAAMALGGVSSLLAGGYLASHHWRLPFVLYVLPAFLVPVVYRFIFDKKAPASQASNDESPSTSFWSLLPFYIFALLGMAVFYVLPTQVPFLFKEAGFESANYAALGLATATFASGSAAFLFPVFRDRLPTLSLVATVFGLLGLGLVLIGSHQQLWSLLPSLFIAGFGSGLTIPFSSYCVLQVAHEGHRGKALGGLSTSLFLGQFLSPLVFLGLLPGDQLAERFLVAGLGVLVLGVSMSAASWFRPRAAPSEEA